MTTEQMNTWKNGYFVNKQFIEGSAVNVVFG